MLTSSDATNYVLYPTTYDSTSVRDPSYYFDSARNKHVICHTAHAFNPSSEFVVAEGDNPEAGLPIEFTEIARVDTSGIAGTDQTWDPNFFVDPADGSVHITVSLSQNGNNGPFTQHETHPTNSALTEWSTPVPITGTAIPANTIDAFFFKRGSTYYILGKNETTKYPFLVSSSSPFSGYDTLVRDSATNWLGVGNCEGFSIVSMGGFERIFFDHYPDFSGVHYVDTSDNNLATCTFSEMVSVTADGVATVRHGSIVDRQA